MDKKRSSEKHPNSKKNAEENLRRTKRNKGKVYKRIISPEDTSSDESDNAYEFRIGGQNSREEASKKLEKKIRSYKSPVKQMTAKKSVEEGFSGESENIHPSRKQNDNINSETSCEEYQHKEAPGKSERKRPSSKLLGKQDTLKKNIDDISRLIQTGEGNTYKRINNREESPTDDSVKDDTCRINVSTQDDILKAGELLKKTPASITLPSAFKSTNDLPFVHWGPTAETKQGAKDKKIEKDYTRAIGVSKLINKDSVNKEWERCKSKYEEQDKKKPGSFTNNAEPETSSSRDEGKDSEIDIKHKTDDTDSACAQNDPKPMNIAKVRKDGEKCNIPRKKKELSRFQIEHIEREDEVTTYEDPNENIDLNISPTYSESKSFSKRRSDPSNALKENRPQPSI